MKIYWGLLIKEGKISRIPIEDRGDSGSSHMRELIGGWAGSSFSVPGFGGGHRLICGRVDDDGLIKDGMPPNVWMDQTLYQGGWPILGPMVIVAFDGPETSSMSELEMSAFRIVPDFRMDVELTDNRAFRFPILTFVPGYDV